MSKQQSEEHAKQCQRSKSILPFFSHSLILANFSRKSILLKTRNLRSTFLSRDDFRSCEDLPSCKDFLCCEDFAVPFSPSTLNLKMTLDLRLGFSTPSNFFFDSSSSPGFSGKVTLITRAALLRIIRVLMGSIIPLLPAGRRLLPLRPCRRSDTALRTIQGRELTLLSGRCKEDFPPFPRGCGGGRPHRVTPPRAGPSGPRICGALLPPENFLPGNRTRSRGPVDPLLPRSLRLSLPQETFHKNFDAPLSFLSCNYLSVPSSSTLQQLLDSAADVDAANVAIVLESSPLDNLAGVIGTRSERLLGVPTTLSQSIIRGTLQNCWRSDSKAGSNPD